MLHIEAINNKIICKNKKHYVKLKYKYIVLFQYLFVKKYACCYLNDYFFQKTVCAGG